VDRPLRSLHWSRFALAAAALLPIACADVVGIEDYTVADSGVAATDGAEALSEVGSADAGADTLDSRQPAPDFADIGNETHADAAAEACPPANEATGLFVSAAGMDSAACGTRALPCKTIGAGLTRAAALGRKTVHVASGVYLEQLVLRSGVRVIGGFDAAFVSNCSPTARDLVVVQAPATESTTVVAESLSDVATVERLTIRSKPSTLVAASESLYGVFARGTSTRVSLRDVRVVVRSGGTGAPGSAGAPGANAFGTCAPATGANGVDGSPGASASEGSFGASGYSAPRSVAGSAGAAGANGTSGGAGSCIRCASCTTKACVAVPREKDSCGMAGAAGCGGAGGAPGAAGGSGGSSLGVYAWDAMISVEASSIEVGDGGDGGAGGAGGAPGGGSIGENGSDGTSCTASCAITAGACTEIVARGNGGAAGGRGGLGGRGGGGGGGAGGFSVPLVAAGSGAISEERTELSFGRGGRGAGGAKDGRAAARWP